MLASWPRSCSAWGNMLRFLVVALSLAACAAPTTTSDESFDPDGKADGATALTFYSGAGKAMKVGSYDAKRYNVTSALRTQGIQVLDHATSYGCFKGYGAKLAPADLQHLIDSPNGVAVLAASLVMG